MVDLLHRLFDIKKGELKVTLLLQGYIFLLVTTLLIIKPAVNALFISELGPDNLPSGYVLVAIVAMLSSYFYTRSAARYEIHHIARVTLLGTIVLLISFGCLMHFDLLNTVLLYFFYAVVAIYAVLATSQFWMIANLAFNVREAKRLFGLIGSGAITGGIFGGYLTTILSPIAGTANLFFIAALFLCICLPIPGLLWRLRLSQLNLFRQKKRQTPVAENPLKLIISSRHLTYIAMIVATGVFVARLVDYQFSSFAVASISDTDELTSFFGFWLSSFNLISLAMQLFLTRRIVGRWGVGFSLMLLPLLLLLAGIIFIVAPELWVVTLLKGLDVSFKQSVNKSAMELIALPLPVSVKKRTKAFIDVVVDSLATGMAGLVLIFFTNGVNVSTQFITVVVIGLSLLWILFVFRIRKEYFQLFRKNLEKLSSRKRKREKISTRESVFSGMIRVLSGGEDDEILYMLNKVTELNDRRLAGPVAALLTHPSDAVKIAAIRNLYFFNNSGIAMEIMPLLESDNEELIRAVLDYLLLFAEKHEEIVFDKYLDHPAENVAAAALTCLAEEARDNPKFGEKYGLLHRIDKELRQETLFEDPSMHKKATRIIEIIGLANDQRHYNLLRSLMSSDVDALKISAIKAAGATMSEIFAKPLITMLSDKTLRPHAITALLNYDRQMITYLSALVNDTKLNNSIRIHIPVVIAGYNSQDSVSQLMMIFAESDELQIRLASLKELVAMKQRNEQLIFDKNKVARMILEECRLYDQTIYAMHTQIIVQYLKKKKHKKSVSTQETEARDSLMEILERRLEASLERIFKLLELRYPGEDIQQAYKGIMSNEDERRTNAIEFLDILLNKSLKSALLPIVESTIPDTTSEEFIERINHNHYTEYECFEMLLNGKDQKLKLAVLYLIGVQSEVAYSKLLNPWLGHDNPKIRDFAEKAFTKLQNTVN